MRPIVVGVDGSAGSRHALRWAAREAGRWQARLRVLSAWDYPSSAAGVTYGAPPPADALRDAREEACQRLLSEEGLADIDGVDVTLEVVEGPAARLLLDAAEESDLLVVGARGLGGFVGLLLGSVSLQCATHARCPVVVVHPPLEEE